MAIVNKILVVDDEEALRFTLDVFLREEGYEVVLVNSNPATIMTDPGTADVTYVEPLNVKTIEKIIAKEKALSFVLIFPSDTEKAIFPQGICRRIFLENSPMLK